MAANSVVDVDDYLSAEGRRLQHASLSGLVGQFAGIKDLVTLHAGLPPPSAFPVASLSLQLAPHPSRAAADPQHAAAPLGDLEVSLAGPQMAAAQQYIFSAGYPQLVQWAKRKMQEAHAPPLPASSSGQPGWDVALTAGAVNALSLAVSLLCDPGDWLIVDEYTYSHALEVVFIPKGLQPLPVAMDEHGMIPEDLERKLQWAADCLRGASGSPASTSGVGLAPYTPPSGRPPRVMYQIPTGHNPTGITIPVSRKRQLYEVCRKWGVMLLEDDAYFFLNWAEPGAAQEAAAAAAATAEGSTGPDSAQGSSYLSMDVDGRVLRVDTFAKVLGPGFRLGWVTGPKLLIDKIALACQGCSVGPCSLSQVCVSNMLEAWGDAGFEAHLASLRALYSRKASTLLAACTQHLTGVATWHVPSAGMFMWITLLPKAAQQGGEEVWPSDDEVAAALVKARVVVVPGSMFWADMQAVKDKRPCPHMRLTFAFLEESELREGVARLGAALRELLGR